MSKETWLDFLQDPIYGYYNEILEIADKYPEEESLLVDYWNLHKYNDEFAERFLKSPRSMIPEAEKAIQELCPEDAKGDIHLRIFNLPNPNYRVEIGDLRTEHLEKYISIEGIVQSRTEVRPRLVLAIYRCQKCNYQMNVPQDDNILKEPYKCMNENCDRKGNTTFELLKLISDYDDVQIITLRESIEDHISQSPPHTIRAYMKNDLCGLLNAGDRVVMNGILFTISKKVKDTKTTDFDLAFETYSIESKQDTYEEIEITRDDVTQIRELAQRPNIHELIRGCIAPSIFEMGIIKDALALQLFGGVDEDSDGEHHRGDIHVFLVGDAGVGKSELLVSMANISPRGLFASGRGATEAGLTATAVNDEFDGRWTLMAGALVLANEGLCAVDEFDKMRKNDRESMHPAMEQQRVPIDKGGIHTTLPTKCAILAAANPKQGVFTDDKLYTEQIQLLPTLLSRFDLIFPIIDRADKAKDEILGRKIIERRRRGEQRRQAKEENGIGTEEETAPIPLDLLRKYIAYAKRHIFPVMTQEVEEHLLKYYVTQRKNNTGVDEEFEKTERRIITPRQLEGLIRLSEASARLRLSDTVTLDDCKRAMRLFDEYMNRIAKDSHGRLDIDTIMSGTSALKRNHTGIIVNVIDNCEKDIEINTVKGVHITDIRKVAQAQGMTGEEVDDAVSRMCRMGELYSPNIDHYQRVK